MALLAHTSLLQEGVAVAAFCDLSGEAAGSSMMGHPVISLDELRESFASAAFVWAGEDLLGAEADIALVGTDDVWVDVCAYDIVNDCVWSFM